MRRAVVLTLVVLLVAVGTAVAVDRILLARTERRVLDDLASSGLALSPDAQVHIAGFPFLTQVWQGSLEQVRLAADAATVDGLELTDVEVVAEGVSTTSPTAAESLEVVATAPEATLTEAVGRSAVADQGLDVTVTIVDGRVLANTSVLGLPVEVGMVPRPAGREIAMGLDSFAILGLTVDAADLPEPLRDALARATVPLDGVPEGLVVTAVEVLPGGLRVRLEGDDVLLDDAALPGVARAAFGT